MATDTSIDVPQGRKTFDIMKFKKENLNFFNKYLKEGIINEEDLSQIHQDINDCGILLNEYIKKYYHNGIVFHLTLDFTEETNNYGIIFYIFEKSETDIIEDGLGNFTFSHRNNNHDNPNLWMKDHNFSWTIQKNLGDEFYDSMCGFEHDIELLIDDEEDLDNENFKIIHTLHKFHSIYYSLNRTIKKMLDNLNTKTISIKIKNFDDHEYDASDNIYLEIEKR